jgi:hypothetical protein
MIFVVFFSSSRQNDGDIPQLGHDHFLPYPFQFIIYQLSSNLTPYILSYWKRSEMNQELLTEPKILLPCSQEPSTRSNLSQTNPAHMLTLYFVKVHLILSIYN